MRRRQILVLAGVVASLMGFALQLASQPAWSAISEARLATVTQEWSESAHAHANVNCSVCHLDPQNQALVVRPSQESCRSCHSEEVETFLLGKHGIRLLEGLSPLTPAIARLPMKVSAHDEMMTCNTCHDVHTVSTLPASVDSCLSCHDDAHSRNYQNSKHAELFRAEGSLPRPSSQAVTCATCHLPRQDLAQPGEMSKVMVNHNNTLTLKPRDRMVSEVCMNCHGMEFSYNSIFDDALVELNFARPPQQDLKTLEMVRVIQDKRLGDP